jgi:hypothetical protein
MIRENLAAKLQDVGQVLREFMERADGRNRFQECHPYQSRLTMKVLVVDFGGTHVKILATGQKQSREFPSGCRA